jgi:hypothetical protein
MAGDLFINYFEFAGLDPSWSREKSSKVLHKMSLELTSKRSAKAQTQRRILDDAMAIFDDPDAYAKYRAEWEQRQPGGSEPRRDSEPPPVNPERSTEPQPEGFRSLLAKLLTTYIEAKASQERPHIGAKASQELPQLAGRWRDSSGYWVHVQQDGAAISAVTTDAWGNPVSQGQGTIKGRTITYMARSPNGQVGQGKLTMSPDGNTIQGQMTISMLSTPMGMLNVLLVRA